MTECKDCGKEMPDPQAGCRDCSTSGPATDDQQGSASLDAPAPALGGEDAQAGTGLVGPDPASPLIGENKQAEGDGQPEDASFRAASRARFEAAALQFGSDAYVFKKLEMLKEQGVPAALFVGVRTTGKTWLMQRMKAALRDKYDCKPPLALTERALDSDQVRQSDRERLEAEDREQAGMSDSQRFAAQERAAAGETGRSDAIVFHRFIHSSGSFALIDVPGERVEQLAKENYAANRDLLAALDYAKSIIVALPADVVLLSDQDLDDDTNDADQRGVFAEFLADVEKLEEFTDGIGTIAAVRSLLQHEGIKPQWKDPSEEPDEFDLKVTPDAVEAHRMVPGQCTPIGGRDGKDCPAFFALTKADRVFATLDVLPDIAVTTQAKTDKVSKANASLRESGDGRMLTGLFARSELNPDNRVGPKDLFSRLIDQIFGASDPTTEISNPPDLVRKFNGTLFNRLTDYMPMSRFDLIAAFYGNTKNSLERRDLRSMEAVGVAELIAWLGEYHDRGLNDSHVWARSVFRRIYGSVHDKGGLFGGAGKFAMRKRLKWTPRMLLSMMFRKEWHPAQVVPLVLGLLGIVGMAWATFDFTEHTGQFADGALYKNFQTALEAGAIAPTGKDPPAIAAIPVVPRDIAPAITAQWSPIKGLTGWRENMKQGSYEVPGEYPGNFNKDVVQPTDKNAKEKLNWLRLEQNQWQADHVCGLAGWGQYRTIVRKAVINGYGDCGLVDELALRSPVVDRMGVVGLVPLLLGWLIVGWTFVYYRWFLATRAAYKWLYHSSVATTRRRVRWAAA